jgi:hypothetical protein
MMRVAIGTAFRNVGTASARRCPAFTAKMLITLKIQHVEFNTASSLASHHLWDSPQVPSEFLRTGQDKAGKSDS